MIFPKQNKPCKIRSLVFYSSVLSVEASWILCRACRTVLWFCLQDVVRSWYSRLPSMVQNAQQLVANSEECARSCSDGETDHRH